jgi:hypothetical protein
VNAKQRAVTFVAAENSMETAARKSGLFGKKERG